MSEDHELDEMVSQRSVRGHKAAANKTRSVTARSGQNAVHDRVSLSKKYLAELIGK